MIEFLIGMQLEEKKISITCICSGFADFNNCVYSILDKKYRCPKDVFKFIEEGPYVFSEGRLEKRLSRDDDITNGIICTTSERFFTNSFGFFGVALFANGTWYVWNHCDAVKKGTLLSHRKDLLNESGAMDV